MTRRDWAHYDALHLVCAESGVGLYQLEISATRVLDLNPISAVFISPECKIEILTFFPED
jgi:hypothetical protein